MKYRAGLIDADSIIYIVSWFNKDTDNPNTVKEAVDSVVTDMLNAVEASHYLGFLGDGICFRHDLAVTQKYKGKRVEEQPWVTKWKSTIKEHLVEKWKFILLDKIEADDAVSICQRALPDTIICGVDKDLLQIPGDHYDYKTKAFTRVDTLGTISKGKTKVVGYGEKFFWSQMITGDITDNIPGLKGKGPAFALKVLSDAKTVQECHDIVEALYLDLTSQEYYDEQHVLLRMLEVEGFGFTIPTPVEYKVVETEPELEFDTNLWKNINQDS